jgi:beta-glucosidase
MFNLSLPHKVVDARRSESRKVLMDGAIGGHILVKNVNNTLPLKDPKMLSLFGYDAIAPPTKNIDTLFQLSYWSEPEMADAKLGSKQNFSQYAPEGTVMVGGRAGGNAPGFISAPYDAFSYRAARDRIWLNWDFKSAEPDVNGASSACLVFVNAMATEGWDRQGLHDDFSDGLVLHVASRCPNTIVVIHSAGPRLVDTFANHPNVTAVIFAHLPGEQSGESLVRLMFADDGAGPWGKLPYTVPKNESDYNVYLPSIAPKGDNFPQSNFTEGVYIDYKHFDREDIDVRYEFGYGLTYSEFSYSDLKVHEPQLQASACDSNSDLWNMVASVGARIRNSGKTKATEIAQLYLGIPDSPIKQLRGFVTLELDQGATGEAIFNLTRRDLSIWDTVAQTWTIQSGTYHVFVGASSREIHLTASFVIQ